MERIASWITLDTYEEREEAIENFSLFMQESGENEEFNKALGDLLNNKETEFLNQELSIFNTPFTQSNITKLYFEKCLREGTHKEKLLHPVLENIATKLKENEQADYEYTIALDNNLIEYCVTNFINITTQTVEDYIKTQLQIQLRKAVD